MFKYRYRKTDASLALRLQCPMIEIAVTNDQLSVQNEKRAECWCTLPKGFAQVFERFLNFEVRDDDVFLVGFMKCGNTWLHEALWQLMNGLDFDYTKTKDKPRRNYFEFNGLFPEQYDRIAKYDKLRGPRLIQTHLPAHLLPKQLWQKKPKTVYVARNVKDAVVSCYYFMQWMGLWRGTMDEFVQDFMNNDLMYTSFWAHIVHFWKLRNEPHIFFVTYEELQRNLAGVLQKLCAFLEKPALTEAELSQMLEHLSFDKMKNNPVANPSAVIKSAAPDQMDANMQVLRRGIIGSYKDELSAENQSLLNEWSSNYLAKHDIKEEDIFGSF